MVILNMDLDDLLDKDVELLVDAKACGNNASSTSLRMWGHLSKSQPGKSLICDTLEYISPDGYREHIKLGKTLINSEYIISIGEKYK